MVGRVPALRCRFPAAVSCLPWPDDHRISSHRAAGVHRDVSRGRARSSRSRPRGGRLGRLNRWSQSTTNRLW